MAMTCSLIAGITLLAFMFSISVLAAVGYGVGISLTPYHVWLSTAFSLGFGFMATKFYSKENVVRNFAGISVFLLVITFFFMYISGMFYDISYDGQVYHQDAVGHLASHWNPFWEYLTAEQSNSAMLLNHYAKGPWLYEAALAMATGQIEQSKVFNFLLIAASFLLAFSALKSSGKLTNKQSVFLSLLLALNPVSLYQSLSFYIDGQLGSLLLCILALAYRLVTQYDKFISIGFIMSIALLINVKFTGVVYGIACIGMVGGWLWLFRQKQAYLSFVKVAAVSLFLGICVIGYNPYITNTVYYGHPFYPLYGAGPNNMDIMTYNSPKGFLKMNSIEKLYIANFSMSTNQFDIEEPALKLPFTVAIQELRPFVYGADVRIGGFGPWFSGMLVISGAIVLLSCFFRTKENQYGMGILACILLSALINPEAWWARYVPQLWFIPICAAGVAWSNRKRTMRYLGGAIAVAAVVNIALISYPYVLGNYYSTKALQQELKDIAENHNPINICFGVFTSNYVWFEQNGIVYVDAPADLADINIDTIRYNYLAAAAEKKALASMFVNERTNENE
jgi:hypothetical protein